MSTKLKRTSPHQKASDLERRQQFVDAMVETGGNWREAGKRAGYTVASAERMRRTLRDEIKNETARYLSSATPAAAKTLVDLLLAKSEAMRYKASTAILDRVGLEARIGVTATMQQRSDEELEGIIEASLRDRGYEITRPQLTVIDAEAVPATDEHEGSKKRQSKALSVP